MILFLFFACEQPECLELQAEPAEQHNVPQMHSSGETYDTAQPEDSGFYDTAYDTGGE